MWTHINMAFVLFNYSIAVCSGSWTFQNLSRRAPTASTESTISTVLCHDVATAQSAWKENYFLFRFFLTVYLFLENDPSHY